jgi:hypothetical protein
VISAIVIGREQAQHLIGEIQAAEMHALASGADDYTIMLMTTDEDDEYGKFQVAREKFSKGNAMLSDVPMPDQFFMGGIFTIALPGSVDRFEEMLDEASDQ